jgi:hypothetical protein
VGLAAVYFFILVFAWKVAAVAVAEDVVIGGSAAEAASTRFPACFTYCFSFSTVIVTWLLFLFSFAVRL